VQEPGLKRPGSFYVVSDLKGQDCRTDTLKLVEDTMMLIFSMASKHKIDPVGALHL
jgi:hypothetical protein